MPDPLEAVAEVEQRLRRLANVYGTPSTQWDRHVREEAAELADLLAASPQQQVSEGALIERLTAELEQWPDIALALLHRESVRNLDERLSGTRLALEAARSVPPGSGQQGYERRCSKYAIRCGRSPSNPSMRATLRPSSTTCNGSSRQHSGWPTRSAIHAPRLILGPLPALPRETRGNERAEHAWREGAADA